jgi:hypothetical protein
MSLVDFLIADFASCLEYFVKETPFLDSRYNFYLATMEKRSAFPGVADAINSDEFLTNVRQSLMGFFRLARAGLLPPDQFVAEIRRYALSIERFAGRKLGAEPNGTGNELWGLISQMKLTANKKEKKKKDKPRLVSGAKALHMLLPDLVVPIDRQYTGAFLFRYAQEFDSGEEGKTFNAAYTSFRKIALAVNPGAYVGTHRLHSTPRRS